MGMSKTRDHIKIKIKMPNPSQEPPASSKAPNEDFKEMDALRTLKIKIESQNLDNGYIKDQQPYQNQVQGAKPQSETCSILQSPNWGLKGHWCHLHLQNLDTAKIWIMGMSKTRDRIKIKIKMPNSSQEPPVSSKAPNEDLKDMDVLCTSKIRIESQTFGSWMYQRPVPIYKNKSRCQIPVRNLQHPPKPKIRT